MKEKRKPINWLVILTIMAIAVWYGSYIQKSPFMGKSLETFMYMGQGFDLVEADKIETGEGFGYITPQVLDGFTDEPIEGATLVIPETNASYKTDKEGNTPRIRIRMNPDPRFSKINPKSWGEATLIAYKKGYREYVLLNINIWEDQERKGPKIRLFPKENENLDTPMSIVEGPNQLWINSLVEKYRP